MQKWTTTFCLICIFHCAGYSNELYARATAFADSLKLAGETKWAAAEYERAAYHAMSNSERTMALLAKSDCLLSAGKTKEAENAASRIYYFDLADSLHFRARYQYAFCSYLNQGFEQANSQLLAIEELLPETYAMQASILYALSLNELRDWDTAREKLIDWATYTYQNEPSRMDSLHAVIKDLYNERNYPKYKKPERAFFLSSVLPGSGQVYAGYLLDGAFSTLMVLSGVGIAAYGILVAKYYVTGAVLGFGIIQRFHTAGTKRSEFLANKRNHKNKRKFNDLLEQHLVHL